MRFHLYAYDMTRQVEAHHYYTHYNEDMRKCLIYDTPENDSRLIGIEYIVTEKLFMQLPDEEKHNHCKSCALGKNIKKPFPQTEHKSKEPLDLGHSDVCVPMSVHSFSG